MDLRVSIDQEARILSERIDAAVKENGGAAAVSRLSNTPQRTLSKYMAGDATPSAIALGRIAVAVGKPVDWFLRGSDLPNEAKDGEQNPPDRADALQIMILDVVAGAGNGVDNIEPEIIGYLPFSRERLRQLGIKPEMVRAHELRGDSMEPTIMDKAIVLVDITMRDLVDGRIYSLRAPEGLRVKRVQRKMDGSVLLISDNRERYQPERLSAEEAEQISVLGRVFWVDKLL
jgi:phage repressor protein C with HTH and peptisase S24 domain